MVEKAIRTVLINNSVVNGIVSTRVYSEMAPQSAALPYITTQCISTIPVSSLGGFSGLMKARWQIDCYASTKDGAVVLANAVRLAFVDYVGVTSGVDVRSVYLLNQFDASVEPIDGGQIMIRRKALDFSVSYYEEQPVVS